MPNNLSTEILNGLSVTFSGMSLKDLVIFSHVVQQEGITLSELKKTTGYQDADMQASIRKLTGNKQAAKHTRYLLIKEQQGIHGQSFYLTTKGVEYSKLLNQPVVKPRSRACT